MWRSDKFLRCLLCAAVALACGAAFAADAGHALSVEPFTYLYDANEASAPALSGESALKTATWSKLEEGDTQHRFAHRRDGHRDHRQAGRPGFFTIGIPVRDPPPVRRRRKRGA